VLPAQAGEFASVHGRHVLPDPEGTGRAQIHRTRGIGARPDNPGRPGHLPRDSV